MKRLLQIILSFSICLWGFSQLAWAQEAPLAIENATIYVSATKKLENATLVVKDGKITQVGSNVSIPQNAKRIDGTNMIVTAGLVDIFTRLGLNEVSAVASTREGSFSSQNPIHAAYRVVDGYNPSSISIPLARTGGVTSVVTVPQGSLVSGTSAWVSLMDGLDVSVLATKAPLAMHSSLGEASLSSAEGSRGLALEKLRELFDDVKQYAKRKDAFERNQTRRFSASRLDLEALRPVVQGNLPVVFNVNRASDILAAVRLAKEFGLKVVIAGGAEAWRVADELAKANIAVILDPSANLPSSFDALYVREDAAKVLSEAGVLVAISTSGSATDVRQLRQLAGIAVANGLPWETALASISELPAKIFDMKQYGTLEVGSIADFVVWSGDPLEISSRPMHVFCQGEEQSLRTHQSLLAERYLTLPNHAKVK